MDNLFRESIERAANAVAYGGSSGDPLLDACGKLLVKWSVETYDPNARPRQVKAYYPLHYPGKPRTLESDTAGWDGWATARGLR